MSLKQYVYNLQFPDYRDEMTILGHVFRRIEGYEDKVKRLSHHVRYVGEFELDYSTGEHVITATVSLPNQNQSPLAWGAPMPILEDILLILSLFTGREVFSFVDDRPMGIKRDARPYLCYETLGVSLPVRLVNNEWDMPADIGFEEGLERVLKLIHTKEWLEKFEGGSLLFIARQIYTFQILEKAFLMSYVFWEHIFYMENYTTLSEKDISDRDGAEKVRFLLEAYGFTPKLNGKQKDLIYKSLTQTRNDLAHYGVFRSGRNSTVDAINFIELTTRLLAKVLGLVAADAKNTKQWLENMIDDKPVLIKAVP